MKLTASILFTLALALPAEASVRVAFLEFYKPSGERVQLEPDGRFAHVAISYKQGWLHAHPFRGVEVISQSELEKMGTVASVLKLAQLGDLTEQNVSRFLGKPYDADFSWADDRIYCSELVAKILNLPPEPMHFDPKLWPEKYLKYEGLPGISPDKIYRRLRTVAY